MNLVIIINIDQFCQNNINKQEMSYNTWRGMQGYTGSYNVLNQSENYFSLMNTFKSPIDAPY